jgi:Pao retrotransposon peptidase
MYRDICEKSNKNWEATITKNEIDRWTKWRQDMIAAGKVRIQRYIGTEKQCAYHVFSDASQLAIGYVIYVSYRTNRKKHLLYS